MRTVQIQTMQDVMNFPEEVWGEWRDEGLAIAGVRYFTSKADLQRRLADMIELIDEVEMDALFWGESEDAMDQFVDLHESVKKLCDVLVKQGQKFRELTGP